jgi:hypothetical protein
MTATALSVFGFRGLTPDPPFTPLPLRFLNRRAAARAIKRRCLKMRLAVSDDCPNRSSSEAIGTIARQSRMAVPSRFSVVQPRRT